MKKTQREPTTTYEVRDLTPGTTFVTPCVSFTVPSGVTRVLITVWEGGSASAVGTGGGKTWQDISPLREK